MPDDKVTVSIIADASGFVSGTKAAAGATDALRVSSAQMAEALRQAGGDLSKVNPALLGIGTAAKEAAAGATAAGEAMKETGRAAEGMKGLTSGATQEVVRLGRAFAYGRFDMIPGELLTLTSRLGALQAIVAGITPEFAAASVAALALAGGIAAIAVSSERANAAMRAIGEGFAGKGIALTVDQLRQINDRLEKILGPAKAAAGDLGRMFAQVPDSSEDVIAMLTGFTSVLMKQTGETAQQAGKKVATEWAEAVKDSPDPQSAVQAMVDKFSKIEAVQPPVERIGKTTNVAQMAQQREQAAAIQKAWADAYKTVADDAETADARAAASAKTLTSLLQSNFATTMALVAQGTKQRDDAIRQAREGDRQDAAARSAEIAHIRAVTDAAREGTAQRVELASKEASETIALYGKGSTQAIEAQTRLTGAVTAEINERHKVIDEINDESSALSKLQAQSGASALAKTGGKSSILSLLGIGGGEEQAQQEIATLSAGIQGQMAALRSSFQQAVPAGNFDQAIAALNNFKGGLADIPALMQQIGVSDETQFSSIIAELNKARTAQQQYADEVQSIQARAARQTTQEWQQALAPIGSAFSGLLTGMLTRSETWRTGILHAADQVATGVISAASRGAVQWIATEISKTAATAAGTAARTGLESTSSDSLISLIAKSLAQWLGFETAKTAADAGGAAAGIAAAKAEGTAYAGEAAAAAMASVAAIPIVGWAMAPGVGASTFAEAMGFASFDVGSVNLPADMAALVHKSEMIVPADLAAQVRSPTSGVMLGASAGGGAGGVAPAATGSAGAGTTIIHNWSLSAADGPSLLALMRKDRGAFQELVNPATAY